MWKHDTCLVTFLLVMDNFGIKYVGNQHAEHLLSVLCSLYIVTEDWKGYLFNKLTLKWTPTYGARIQYFNYAKNSPLLPATRLTRVQHIVGCIIYYSCVVDQFVRVDISYIASDQSKAIETTHNKCYRLLEYSASSQSAEIWYQVSGMALYIHSYTSCFS